MLFCEKLCSSIKGRCIVLSTLLVMCLTSCINTSTSYSENRAPNNLSSNESISKTNKEIVNAFVNDELLKNIYLKEMYPAESVIKELGEVHSETIENAKINYEGMTGSHLRKIEFNLFFAIIYQLDDGNEIFGHLSLKKDIQYSKFTIGTDLRDYINIDGDSINKWNNNHITVYGNYQNDLDMEISITYDQLYIIQGVDINIGSI